MNHHTNNASNSDATASFERPAYEPPRLIDCGTLAALTLGSGGVMGSDMWGAGGAGGGS
jgi:hypothetical protein